MFRFFTNYFKKKSIENLCNKFKITGYIINDDLSIDVCNNVSMSSMSSKIINGFIPIKYNKVDGYFDCGFNKIISLKGSPKHVDGYFNFSFNNINTFKYVPIYIGDDIVFGNNNNIHSLHELGDSYIDNFTLYLNENPIKELVNVFNNDIVLYKEYMDIYSFHNENYIYKTRFLETLSDLNGINKKIIEIPTFNNYEII